MITASPAPGKQSVEIVEVAPRDGLQNEHRWVPTEQKVELVRRALDAGIRRIEVTSFVSRRAVPLLADAEDVVASLGPSPDGVTFIGLVMNHDGVERALAAGVDDINAVVVATDTFSQRNQRESTAVTLDRLPDLVERARSGGASVSVTIGASFGCPFEGEVPLERLEWVLRGVARAEPDEVALGDSIGVAAPADVLERVRAAETIVPTARLRMHFHNTRNIGIANAYAAVQAGVSTLDASLGGIGGCPFAPAATGNIPTEDLVYLLDRCEVSTGVDRVALVDSARWLSRVLGAEVPGMLSRAGDFPPAPTGGHPPPERRTVRTPRR